MPYEARAGSITCRYSTPSMPTCTLSFVMQICSAMSIADSFRPWRYAIRSMNGTRMWKPALSVLLYLPSRSTMKALCCGTTIAVLTSTTNATAATTSTSKNTP